jgi:hypothetical protein
MAQDIKPGTTVNVKVTSIPTNAGAAKTIVRLLHKDAQVKREQKRLEKVREAGIRHHQRGGRQWAVRVVKVHPVAAEVGQSGTILATADVLRDLGSVERFVEVTPA